MPEKPKSTQFPRLLVTPAGRVEPWRNSGAGHGVWRQRLRGGAISAALHGLLLVALAKATLLAPLPGGEITLTLPADSSQPALQTLAISMAGIPDVPVAAGPRVRAAEALPGVFDAAAPFGRVVSPAARREELLAGIQSLVHGAGASGTAAPGDQQSGEGTAGAGNSAEFFGIVAAGKKFVFVVDCSLSMAGRKWQEACYELTNSIEQLSESQSFYVLLFDGESHPMFAPGPPAPALLPATRENQQRFRQWLRTMRLGFNTSPCQSVKRACQLAPDAIFLLSDGEFNDPTAMYLRTNNRQARDKRARGPAVVVHTVCFYSREGQPMLERIAAENGGRCSVIAAAAP